MRLFEIILLISLFLSIINLFFRRNIKFKVILPLVSAFSAAASIFIEGSRSLMFPAYALSIVMLILCALKIKKKHTVLKVFCAILICLTYILSAALPMLFPVVNLPKPRGSYAVGTKFMSFTDTSRKGVIVSNGKYRVVPVQVWYPASNTAEKKIANWIKNRLSLKYFAKSKHIPDLLDQLRLVKTNSFLDAGISSKEDKYPVILFSGGGGMFNAQNTIQMEELASHGYVVFAVGHPYDDFAAIYPDGSVVPSDLKQSKKIIEDANKAIDDAKAQFRENESDPEFERVLIRNCKYNTEDVNIWSDDMCFTADEIEKMNLGSIQSIFKGKLDTSKMGIFGHSFGGATSGETCLKDSRFKAFINMDGTPFGNTVDSEIKQPFMILSEGSDGDYNKLKVEDGYSKNQKNYLNVSIKGTEHMNFTDFNTLFPIMGKPLKILGTIKPSRQTQIVNDYVLSFFNKYLKNTSEPLIDNEMPKYKEVTVEKK